jgi:hypothetical protein
MLKKVMPRRISNELREKIRKLQEGGLETLKLLECLAYHIILFSIKDLRLEDVLGVEVIQTSLVNSKVVGSVCFASNKGAILRREASDEDVRLVKNVLKVEVEGER